MLHNFQRWEEKVEGMYDVDPLFAPLELRVKYCSIPIFANASRSRRKMFRQIEALTDAEWQSTTIDSVGCSPELLGIIRDINSLSQSFDREKGKIIY
jgi:hypothetical protein